MNGRLPDSDPLRRSRALHEILQLARKVVEDRAISDEEAQTLREWVERNPDMIGVWPVDTLIGTLRSIFADGQLSDDGRARLLKLLSDMSGEEAN